MEKTCIICSSTGRYKCPTCLVYYCSAPCCKKHRQHGCKVILESTSNTESGPSSGDDAVASSSREFKFPSSDTIPPDKFKLLSESVKLKELLRNPHLQEILTTISKANDADKIMEMAMQEPLFLEFAEVCLQTVSSIPQ